MVEAVHAMKRATKLIVALLFVSIVVALIIVKTRTQSFIPDFCPPMSEQMNISNQNTISSNPTGAYYDEQLMLGFGNNATSLSYNVTAIAQNDSQGFGPLYSVNGRTQTNLWYQVGLTWNWGSWSEKTHSEGFYFFYEVWNASSKKSIFPKGYGSGSLPFTKMVSSGDIVLLSLTVGGSAINMSAYDWDSNGSQSISFPSYGANGFLGSTQPLEYASMLMTEWYHVLPFFCSQQAVVYSNKLVPAASGWLGIDEWNFTGVPPDQWFNASDIRQFLFSKYTPSASPLTETPIPYEANGTRIYANSTDFWTM